MAVFLSCISLTDAWSATIHANLNNRLIVGGLQIARLCNNCWNLKELEEQERNQKHKKSFTHSWALQDIRIKVFLEFFSIYKLISPQPFQKSKFVDDPLEDLCEDEPLITHHIS